MPNAANPVAGRLGLPPADRQTPRDARGDRTPVGVRRLGLSLAAGPPAPTDDPAAPPAFRRKTFKLPAGLAWRLAAYAAVSRQYQYAVATAALADHLDEALALMDVSDRTAVAERERRLRCSAPALRLRRRRRAAAAAKAGRPTARPGLPARLGRAWRALGALATRAVRRSAP
jgi:hypothetical protein